jgi:glycosyltransferase involved in cell wall biosynthesis
VVTLSVVIPATNRPPTLSRVLAAVEQADAPPEEIILVEEPPNAGPATARNLGSKRASGDVLVFVDADVEVRTDAFARIRRAFDEDGDLTAVFGSYDDDPGADGLVSDFRNLLHHFVHHEGAGPTTTFWAGLGAIRREAFLRAGGFDEIRFPHPSIEDIELGGRLHRDGARLVLDPSIQGKHLKRWTLWGMVDTDLRRRGVPWLRLMLDDGAPSNILNLGWRHRVSTGASIVLLGAVARRNARLTAGTLVLLVALDGDFYRFLLRRRGPRQVAAGIPLHIVHRLTSVVSIPVALAGHLRERSWSRRLR